MDDSTKEGISCNKVVFPSYFSFRNREPETYSANTRTQKCGSSCSAKGGMRCVVCGDVSSGKHYGVLACNGCSGFFKRSVRRKLIYRCQASGGDCLVDKTHRNQCQACRLKKCLECGMNRDAVQNERQPRNTATVRTESAFSSPLHLSEGPSNHCPVRDIAVGVFPAFLTLQQNLVTPVFSKSNPPKCRILCREEKDRSTEVESFIQDVSTRILGSEEHNMCKNSFQHQFDTAACVFYETSFQILMHTIRWVRSLPTYSGLSLHDQEVLLETAWSDLFLLGIIQWSMPMDSCPLFTAVDLNLITAEHKKCLHDLQKTFSRFKMLATDFTEFACLKAIVLFQPEANYLKDVQQVQLLQDHAQLMLAHHIKSEHFDFSFRFGRHLLLIPALRQIHLNLVEKIFFSQSPGFTTMEKLIGNLLKE